MCWHHVDFPTLGVLWKPPRITNARIPAAPWRCVHSRRVKVCSSIGMSIFLPRGSAGCTSCCNCRGCCGGCGGCFKSWIRARPFLVQFCVALNHPRNTRVVAACRGLTLLGAQTSMLGLCELRGRPTARDRAKIRVVIPSWAALPLVTGVTHPRRCSCQLCTIVQRQINSTASAAERFSILSAPTKTALWWPAGDCTDRAKQHPKTHPNTTTDKRSTRR